MKKMYLRGWVEILLTIVTMLIFVGLALYCEVLSFICVMVLSLIMLLNTTIIKRHGKLLKNLVKE